MTRESISNLTLLTTWPRNPTMAMTWMRAIFYTVGKSIGVKGFWRTEITVSPVGLLVPRRLFTRSHSWMHSMIQWLEYRNPKNLGFRKRISVNTMHSECQRHSLIFSAVSRQIVNGILLTSAHLPKSCILTHLIFTLAHHISHWKLAYFIYIDR